MPHDFPPDLDARTEIEAKLRSWREGNAIAIEQSRRGLSKPLDLESILARIEARLANRT
jgi:hypothetical protein